MKTANNYTIPLTKLITELDSDRVNGLTSLEATNRISRYGSNTIQSDKGKHPLKIVLSQFNNLLVYLLCNTIKRIKGVDETYALAEDNTPKIIIAGSGMAAGGRVLTYFEKYLGDENATILLVGFQAEGTRGRALLEGASEIKMRGKFYKVKAHIENIEGLSGHADQNGLIDWMNKLKSKPNKIFIVHSEADGAKGLQEKIKKIYKWECEIPVLNQAAEFELKI
jgi:predicted metal-dependent RNase